MAALYNLASVLEDKGDNAGDRQMNEEALVTCRKVQTRNATPTYRIASASVQEQAPIIEQAIETAAPTLGSDKPRG